MTAFTDDLLSDLDATTLRYAILDRAGYTPAQIGALLDASADQIRDTGDQARPRRATRPRRR